MDISITSTADLAANWTRPKSASDAVIPENETFHQALQTASGKDTPEKILGVAKQFEALMIGQMLKSAREASGGGWLGNEDEQDDQTGSLVMEMAEQGLSQALAARGGLGIAKMVAANLEHGHARTPTSESVVPASPASLKSKETNTDLKHSVPLAAPPAPALAAPPIQAPAPLVPHPARLQNRQR